MERTLQKDVTKVGELKGPKLPTGPTPTMQNVELSGSLVSELDRLQQEWKPFEPKPDPKPKPKPRPKPKPEPNPNLNRNPHPDPDPDPNPELGSAELAV